MTTTNECRRCGRPARDSAYCCDDCANLLAIALGDVPWLEEQLDITISRQKGVDYTRAGGGKGAKKPSERPAPANLGASEAKAALRQMLVSWTLFAHEEQIRNQSPKTGLPADTLSAMSAWLLWRVDGLALHDIGPDAVEEITSAVANCHRLIDRPADRQYLGECECGGDLWAHRGAAVARCRDCGASVDAESVRERVLTELDDRLFTAAEIAKLATHLGLRANREQVRKRVNQWHTRKRITAESAFGEEPVFRFGIVWRLLVQDETKAGVA